ncbi:MAG: hypothetical protein HXS54_00230 [Theionarchaea archaeon]|nr:hypothetical protein [Theionarchaea archaeon]
MRKTSMIIEELRRSRQERIETFRLIIYVIILGIFVNALVSFVISGNFILVVLFLVSIAALFVLTVKYLILNPSVFSDEFPTILVLDHRQNLISLPHVTRRPESPHGKLGTMGSTFAIKDRGMHPFVINAFRAYLIIRNDQKPDLDNDMNSYGFFEQLIVYLLIEKYLYTHRPPIWQAGKIHTQIGPFPRFGSYPPLPSEEVSLSGLAEETRNIDSRIARLYKSSAKFAVPKGTRVTLLPSNTSDGRHKICFHHKLITLTISVGAVGGTGEISMRMWPRKMLSCPDDLYAFGFTIEYEIKFRRNLRRIRSSFEFEHICSWVSDFIENLREYVRWYDEDVLFENRDLIDFVAIKSNEIIYSLREQEEPSYIAYIL